MAENTVSLIFYRNLGWILITLRIIVLSQIAHFIISIVHDSHVHGIIYFQISLSLFMTAPFATGCFSLAVMWVKCVCENDIFLQYCKLKVVEYTEESWKNSTGRKFISKKSLVLWG